MSSWSNWRVKPSSGIRRFDCLIYHLYILKRFSVYPLEIVGALDFELRGSGSGLGPGHCALFVGLQCLSPLRSINESTGELSGNCNFRRFHRPNSCPARPKLCSTAPAKCQILSSFFMSKARLEPPWFSWRPFSLWAICSWKWTFYL